MDILLKKEPKEVLTEEQKLINFVRQRKLKRERDYPMFNFYGSKMIWNYLLTFMRTNNEKNSVSFIGFLVLLDLELIDLKILVRIIVHQIFRMLRKNLDVPATLANMQHFCLKPETILAYANYQYSKSITDKTMFDSFGLNTINTLRLIISDSDYFLYKKFGLINENMEKNYDLVLHMIQEREKNPDMKAEQFYREVSMNFKFYTNSKDTARVNYLKHKEAIGYVLNNKLHIHYVIELQSNNI